MAIGAKLGTASLDRLERDEIIGFGMIDSIILIGSRQRNPNAITGCMTRFLFAPQLPPKLNPSDPELWVPFQMNIDARKSER